MDRWTCVYELNSQREPVAGCADGLSKAIRRGADLRLCTTFDYEEHMGPGPELQGLVEESVDLRMTYLIDDRWAAGITTTRFPADSCLGFQPYPSLSFFLYNQDGHQGIARAFFTGQGLATAENTESKVGQIAPKFSVQSIHDAGTRSPSQNFIYNFGYFRFYVCDDWTEVLAHDAEGNVLSGSHEELGEAARAGCSLKVGVRDLCLGLGLGIADDPCLTHEVFIELGSVYHHRDRKLLGAESLPVVRVTPAIPLAYAGGAWNFGWILPRTDGTVFHEVVDPYTRAFQQVTTRNAVRWFAR